MRYFITKEGRQRELRSEEAADRYREAGYDVTEEPDTTASPDTSASPDTGARPGKGFGTQLALGVGAAAGAAGVAAAANGLATAKAPPGLGKTVATEAGHAMLEHAGGPVGKGLSWAGRIMAQARHAKRAAGTPEQAAPAAAPKPAAPVGEPPSVPGETPGAGPAAATRATPGTASSTPRKAPAKPSTSRVGKSPGPGSAKTPTPGTAEEKPVILPETAARKQRSAPRARFKHDAEAMREMNATRATENSNEDLRALLRLSAAVERMGREAGIEPGARPAGSPAGTTGMGAERARLRGELAGLGQLPEGQAAIRRMGPGSSEMLGMLPMLLTMPGLQQQMAETPDFLSHHPGAPQQLQHLQGPMPEYMPDQRSLSQRFWEFVLDPANQSTVREALGRLTQPPGYAVPR